MARYCTRSTKVISRAYSNNNSPCIVVTKTTKKNVCHDNFSSTRNLHTDVQRCTRTCTCTVRVVVHTGRVLFEVLWIE